LRCLPPRLLAALFVLLIFAGAMGLHLAIEKAVAAGNSTGDERRFDAAPVGFDLTVI